jgi:hypothetical protein
MGRVVRNQEDENLPETILVEGAQVSNSCVYVARALSDVFVKDGPRFRKIRELSEIQ